jgi:hypothetical protein
MPLSQAGRCRGRSEATSFMHAQPAQTKEIIGKYAKTEAGPDLDETYATYDPNWAVVPVRPGDTAAALRYLPDPRLQERAPRRLVRQFAGERALR